MFFLTLSRKGNKIPTTTESVMGGGAIFWEGTNDFSSPAGDYSRNKRESHREGKIGGQTAQLAEGGKVRGGLRLHFRAIKKFFTGKKRKLKREETKVRRSGNRSTEQRRRAVSLQCYLGKKTAEGAARDSQIRSSLNSCCSAGGPGPRGE